MDERIARMIQSIGTLEGLAQFEKNARDRNALSEEVAAAIHTRSGELGRTLVAERTGLDLTNLSPAEEKIVEAVSVYAGVKKRERTNANRTLTQISDHGLLGAAEIAVTKGKPTIGYQTLADTGKAELSYEQIVVDHPDEFSPRALWFSRRTLGQPNDSDKPPAKAVTPVQRRTEALLHWLRDRSSANDGPLPPHTNAEAAAELGMTDLSQHGRVFGNIQSRIDFACYAVGRPPLGLTADAPFEGAWRREGRSWAFPVETMREAAQSRVWSTTDFDLISKATESLPGQAHISWKRELSTREENVRAWAVGLATVAAQVSEGTSLRRNPNWSRDELILALDLYLRFRAAPASKDSPEVAELSDFLGRLGRARGTTEAGTYRNTNGVYMKTMNFRRFDPRYAAEGKVGLQRGNKEEASVWIEFADNPAGLAAAVESIRESLNSGGPTQDTLAFEVAPEDEPPYWVFVCNPKRWAVDRFLDRRIEYDTWGVRPSDRERFAPGQLGIVRVGVDRRSVAERDGKPPLEAGIYALCAVESAAFNGTGANDEFWAPGEGRDPDWPTVRIRYLRTYRDGPLTIERLRAERPEVSHLLLSGFQAASFPISAVDFHAVVELLKERLEEAPLVSEQDPKTVIGLAELERKYLRASPEVKERLSRTIERGPVGDAVKRANGYRCQVCEGLGLKPTSFLKADGTPYVEAHHVMPVSAMKAGSLAASNVMTLCANHHREMHYGSVAVTAHTSTFEVTIGGTTLSITRHGDPAQAA